jgi:hypothetical protein
MAPGTHRTQYREVLASLVQKTQTRFPALNGRLTNATKLALLDDVELHDDGSATVHSASDPTRHYRIVEGTCTCRDWEHAPEHLCQHRLAAGLVRKAHELLPPTAEPVPAPALGEAPCSANCHVLIGGKQVQVTLRGHDEQAVLTRLEAVLQRYPQPQPTPQAASQGEGWCAVHNCTMQENVKHGQRWFSHKKQDGSWCKGKGR